MKNVDDIETLKAILPHLKQKVENNCSELQPWSCDKCPFKPDTFNPIAEFVNDLAEANYICPVDGSIVWG